MSFDFREGAEAAAEGAKGGGNFPRVEFFSLDDKGQAILRFLHDYTTDRNADGTPKYPHLAHPSFPMSTAWIVINQHGYIPTKDKPDGYDGNWPSLMGGVCRKDKAFKDTFPDCYVCDFMKQGNGKPYRPQSRSWALAVMREEVRENGELQGYRDMTREVAVMGEDGKPTGETTIEKRIVVVNMAWKNFFSALEGFGKIYGTILDRDYVIIRKGDDKDTDYQIVGLDPIPAADGSRFDVRNPTHYERFANTLDIPLIIAERAGDDFYARFFDKRVTAPAATSTNGAGAPAEQQAKPETDGNMDKMAEIASRVRDYRPEGSTAPPAAAPQAEAPTPPTPSAPAAAPASPATPQPAAAGSGPRNFDS